MEKLSHLIWTDEFLKLNLAPIEKGTLVTLTFYDKTNFEGSVIFFNSDFFILELYNINEIKNTDFYKEYKKINNGVVPKYNIFKTSDVKIITVNSKD